jgi:hypothetical protein
MGLLGELLDIVVQGSKQTGPNAANIRTESFRGVSSTSDAIKLFENKHPGYKPTSINVTKKH